jgi:RNA polymerase sigma-70 factor (ECF subfamily)
MEKLSPAYVASLVKRAQENDSDAFAELYIMTYKQQYLFARNYLRDDYLAQDAVQEVYILALKNIQKLKERKVFPAWVRQINLRVCYDMARKLKEHPEDQPDEEVFESIPDESPSNDPEARTMHLFENQDLNNALGKLPLEEKEALLLKYSAGMKLDEIAGTMNVSVSSVTRYLSRGQQHLSKIMKEGGD